MAGEQLLTASRLRTFRRCARLHHYAYELGYRPVFDDEALRFGSLIHVGLEAWWNALLTGGDPLEAAIAAVALVVVNGYDQVRADELLRGYHYRWFDAGLVPIAVEVEFQAQLLNPETGAASRTWRLAGKLDVLARDAAGRVVIVEHKTSAEDIGVGSTYWMRLRMDGQVSAYFEGARALGHVAEACVYDVIGKPTLRPSAVAIVDDDDVKIVLDGAGLRVRTKNGKKWRETGDTAQGYVLQTRPETPEEYRARLREAIAEAPDRYYQRGEVVRLEAELEDHAFDTWQLGMMIREGGLAGRHPKNPDSCVMYGRTCAFFEVCTGAGSLDDTSRFVRLENVHPELAQAASATT